MSHFCCSVLLALFWFKWPNSSPLCLSPFSMSLAQRWWWWFWIMFTFLLCTIELCPAWMAQWQNHACLYYSYYIQSYIWVSTCSSNKHPWNTCISQQAGIPQFRILKQHMHPKTISKYKSMEMEVCFRHCFTFTHLHLVAICCLTMLTVMYGSSNFRGIVSTP